MNVNRLIVFGALLLATSVAGAQSNENPPPPDPAAVTAPSDPDADAPADSQHGTIVFFRPRKMIGAAVGFKVREGETELGKLRNGTFFELQVAPGSHQYVVHSETQDVLTMEIEAGETYFVQGTLGMGILAGRPNLAPSDRATFESMKDKLKEKAPLSADDGKPDTE
jgi:hypothetical protein